MQVIRTVWRESGRRFSHHGKYWHFENVLVEPQPIQRPHPPLWMGAGSPASIRRAAREGYNLLLDQIASIELTSERVEIYRQECERAGKPFDANAIAVTRALHIVTSEEERRRAYALRAAVLKRIGGLARPGERQSTATMDLDGDAALIGT